MTDSSSDSTSVTDAIEAMRARGIDNAESLVTCTSPERIVATCEWWDKRNAGVGLLAMRIREGGVTPISTAAPGLSKIQQLRQRFSEVAAKFPPMSVVESHRKLAKRCWPEDAEDCEGAMIVVDNDWPHLSMRCDDCGFEAAIPAKSLGVLPEQPPRPPRPIPDPQPQVPVSQRRPLQPARVMGRLAKLHALANDPLKESR